MGVGIFIAVNIVANHTIIVILMAPSKNDTNYTYVISCILQIDSPPTTSMTRFISSSESEG